MRSAGRVTEEGMIRDGVAGIQWASTKANETGSRLVLRFGSGIGAAPRESTPPRGSSRPPERRARTPARGGARRRIVAEGGLSSCVEIAQKLFSWMPLGLLMKDKWAGTIASAPEQYITAASGAGGERDEIVPLWCGRRLHDAVRGKKVWKMFKRGGHNNLMTMPGSPAAPRTRRSTPNTSGEREGRCVM